MGTFINLTGQKFGKLTVINKSEKPCRWTCRCECGIIKDINGYNLKAGLIRTCGNGICRPCVINLTGKTFGNLTVIGQEGRKTQPSGRSIQLWLVECICKKRYGVNGASLRRGDSTSCGDVTCRLSYRDLKDKRFGKLTVIKMNIRHINGKKRTYWDCECDCGKPFSADRESLEGGNTRSCGCLRSDKKEQSLYNQVFASHLRGCKEKGNPNHLSQKKYISIASMACIYCESFYIRKTRSTHNIEVPLNGIDRLNNEPYYKLSNSLPCCWECNREKSGRDFHEWLDRQSRLRNDPSYPAKIIRKLKKMGKKIPPKNKSLD